MLSRSYLASPAVVSVGDFRYCCERDGSKKWRQQVDHPDVVTNTPRQVAGHIQEKPMGIGDLAESIVRRSFVEIFDQSKSQRGNKLTSVSLFH